jgi:hypothetical protein
VRPGDDVAGNQSLAFYAREGNGKYVNISKELGLAVPIPTRGIATADTTGTGALDLAIARQWGPPAFYANESPDRGDYLDLNLVRPAESGTGTPAYDATVTVTTPSGSQVSQLDGGGGHGGFRSFGVHFGLGAEMGPATVQVRWLDLQGHRHQQTTTLKPGSHTLMLTDGIQEVTNR